MCWFPGAIKALPAATQSPSLASRTETAHSVSSRSAKARVNCSGMCCTMTTPGQSTGREERTSRSASVPPAEAPRAMRSGAADAARRELVEERDRAIADGGRRPGTRFGQGMRTHPAHVLDEGAARIRVKVDVARVPSAHCGAQDGDALLLEEGLGEIDVSPGHVHDGAGEIQHVGAPEHFGHEPPAVAPRLHDGPDEQVHGVDAEASGLGVVAVAVAPPE